MKRCIGIFYSLYLCSFGYITLLATTQAYQNITWTAPLSLLLALLPAWLYRNNGIDFERRWVKIVRNGDRIFFSLSVLFFCLMLVLSWQLRVEPSWDYGHVLVSAYEFAVDGILRNVEYFARYQNNQMLLYLMTAYFKGILTIFPEASLEFCQLATLPVNCLMIQGAILMTYQTAKLCMGAGKALGAGLFCLSCSPLYLYSPIAYTDTLGLLPLMLIFYWYLRFKRETTGRRWLYFAVSCLFGVFGYFLKATIGIGLIAVVMDAAAECLADGRRRKSLGIVFLVLALAAVTAGTGLSGVINRFTKISPQDYEKYQFPPTHWVMMTLTTYGGYNQADADFTAGFSSMEERRSANVRVIKERLENMGVRGTLRHIFYTKWWFTWTYSTCAADDFLKRFPREPGILYEFFANDGTYYPVYRLYAHTWWLLTLFLSCLSGWVRRKGRNPLFPFHLSLFGLLLFLSVWECSARYLLLFLPVMAIIAADGAGAGARLLGDGGKR